MAAQDKALLSIMTVLPDYGMSFVGSFFKEGTLKEAEHSALAALHALAEEVLPERKQVQCDGDGGGGGESSGGGG